MTASFTVTIIQGCARPELDSAHLSEDEIEKIFMPQMYALLKEMDHTLEILIIDHEKEPQVI